MRLNFLWAHFISCYTSTLAIATRPPRNEYHTCTPARMKMAEDQTTYGYGTKRPPQTTGISSGSYPEFHSLPTTMICRRQTLLNFSLLTSILRPCYCLLQLVVQRFVNLQVLCWFKNKLSSPQFSLHNRGEGTKTLLLFCPFRSKLITGSQQGWVLYFQALKQAIPMTFWERKKN